MNIVEVFFMDLSNIEFIQKNKPATEKEIQLAENQIHGFLPDIYKDFLRLANGMVLNLCVLYSTSDLIEMYNCNEFEKYAPDYISIGNDNGDRELIIKAEKNAVLCGFLDAGSIGTSEPDEWFDFKSWLEHGCLINDDTEDDEDIDLDSPEYGKVYITRLPDEKLKFLNETKKLFALSISTGVLYKQVNHLPCVIKEGITESYARIIISETSFPECYDFKYK